MHSTIHALCPKVLRVHFLSHNSIATVNLLHPLRAYTESYKLARGKSSASLQRSLFPPPRGTLFLLLRSLASTFRTLECMADTAFSVELYSVVRDEIPPTSTLGPPDGDISSSSPSPSPSTDVTDAVFCQGRTPHAQILLHRPSALRHSYTEPTVEGASSPTSNTVPSRQTSGSVRDTERSSNQLCNVHHSCDNESPACEVCTEELRTWQKDLLREWQYTAMMLLGLFA
ncbi:hypothetical protein PENSPDRAFT_131041 [Peniophora sp. CONT]|nr:hypothetical protein PENSPDRAFT_131041 [Peniophora sp. CONT]